MKTERGMGIISIIILIIIIIAIIIASYHFFENKVNNSQIVNIKANMLLIQGKCKILEETSKVNKNEECLKGKKLSEMSEDNIISEFLNKNIIDSNKLDKYYALSNEDLSNMNLDVENEENSYYIVNYESNEVFITSGYVSENNSSTIYKLEQ